MFLLMVVSMHTSIAQSAIEEYIDIYPPEKLEKRGILYHKSDLSLSDSDTLTLIAYDEYGKESLYIADILHISGKE